MEPQTWITWSEVPKSTTLTEGQLNVPRVCQSFGMDPDTLEIAGREVEWSRNTGYSSNFPDLCQHQPGDGTEDNPIQVDGKPLQGAGTSTDWLTTHELLSRALPPLPLGQYGSRSSAGGQHYYVPDNVEPLDVNPLTGRDWEQDVIAMTQAADNQARWALVLEDDNNTTLSQSGIVDAMSVPLKRLVGALNRDLAGWQPPQKAQGWASEASSSVLQKGLARLQRMQSSSLQPDNLTVVDAVVGPVVAAIAGASSGSCHRQDVVLTLGGNRMEDVVLQQPVDQQQPAEWSGEPVAVGEYKKVYTYLLVLKLQFAFLSCYVWTWVVHLEKDRRTLRISKPIASSTASTPEEPAVTTMAAIHWVQQSGLRTYRDTDLASIDYNALVSVEEYLCATPSGSSESDKAADSDDADHPTIDTDHADDAEDLDYSGGPKKDGGSKRGRQRRGGSSSSGIHKRTRSKHSISPRGTKVAKQQHRSKGASDCRLQLGALICEGRSGLVLHGTHQGQPAVYKLVGPDKDGVAAGINEATSYSTLKRCQGDVLPIFLGWGHLAAGVYYVATSRVDGVPCSQLPSEAKAAAAAAAKKALKQICSVQPGFLHGDLRLANIMIRHGSSDTGAPSAVIIDLAASRMDGTKQEVRAQFRQLEFLFRQ